MSLRITTFQQAIDAMENLEGTCATCGSIVQHKIKGNIVVNSVEMRYLSAKWHPGKGATDPVERVSTVYLVSLRCGNERCGADLAVAVAVG